MKAPRPTLKEDKRYAVITTSEPDPQLAEKIAHAYERLFGIVGMAKARPIFLKGDDASIIVRIHRDCVDSLRCAILATQSFAPRVVGVSGTLKKAREKFLS